MLTDHELGLDIEPIAWNVSHDEFAIETESTCNRCGDFTPHTAIETGNNYGYQLCDVCGHESDWNWEG